MCSEWRWKGSWENGRRQYNGDSHYSDEVICIWMIIKLDINIDCRDGSKPEQLHVIAK
jgi:hypothetical protein